MNVLILGMTLEEFCMQI